MTVWTTPPLIAPKSISKPSIRKHSSSEKLSIDQDQQHYFQQQQQQPPQQQQTQYQDMVKLATVLSFSPTLIPPPQDAAKSSKKASTRFVSACACFLVFFFVTALAFLHCMNLADIPPESASRMAPDLQYQSFASQKKPSFMSVQSASEAPKTSAFRGLGTLLRRGTKAMSELVVAHVSEDAELRDLRLFLRTLHRSGVTARADVVFLFASSNMQSKMMFEAIDEENEYFQRLLYLLSNSSSSSSNADSFESDSSSPSSSSLQAAISNATISVFNVNAFMKGAVSANESSSSSSSSSRPFWGSSAGTQEANQSSSSSSSSEGMRFEWGSIVAFEVSELNPDDALQGFIDGPPVALRRWACYQMLLGMARHKFKQVLLTEANGVAVLGDALAMARKKAGVYATLEDRTWGPEEEVWRREMRERKQQQQQQEAKARNQKRRGGGGRRRRRAAAMAMAMAKEGIYEKVYGSEMWKAMEESEKEKKIVNSGVLAGGIQQMRGVANAMVTEIVRVSLERNSREAFPDAVFLSYLLHRSSPGLGRRVVDHIHFMENGDSFVHAMDGTKQERDFVKRNGQAYAVVHGGGGRRSRRRWRWSEAEMAIWRDICGSRAEAMVYRDCS